MPHIPLDIGWWITAIEIPAISALFWLYWNSHSKTQDCFSVTQKTAESRERLLRKDFNDFQLAAATTYARRSDLKELESRLTAHLLRIEAKLDTTALKTEALNATDRR